MEQKYLVEGFECSLAEIKKENSFDNNDELFQRIASMKIGETIGENCNMATVKRIS